MGFGMPPRTWTRLALVLAVCLGNAAAFGEDAKPVLASFDKGSAGLDEGCVARAELQRGTERFVGRQVFGADEQADVFVVIDVRSEKRANITLLDPKRRPLGRRGIEGESCSELNEGLVLALSLMLDFTTEDVERLRQSEAAANSTQATPTATSAPTVAPPEHPPKEDSSPHEASKGEMRPSSEEPAKLSAIRFHVGADGRFGVGFAPLPLVGLGAAVGIRTRNDWLFELRGGYWFERKFSRGEGNIAISAVEGGLAVAPALVEVSGARVRLGGVGSLGRVLVVGVGYPGAATGSALALRAGLLGRLEMDAGPLVAQVSTQFEAPLVGYRAVVVTPQGPSEQFEGGPIIFVLSAGALVPF
jgi:hypothetical protein